MTEPLDVTENGEGAEAVDRGWGHRLREIRETNGISLEDVMAELRLEIKLLQQIEAEEVEQLPSAPFVKGYLRNYARMLGVDAAPILESYGRVCGEDAPGLTNVSKVRELTSKDTAPRSATWIIVTVLIVSVLVWWWSQIMGLKKGGEVEPPPAAEAPQSEAASGGDAAINGGVLELPLPVQLPQQPVQAPQEGSTPAAALAPVPAAVSGGALGGAAAPAATAVAAVPKSVAVTMKFSGESWVDISDATGKRLFMDLAKAGSSLAVEGVPPFNVLLGNSPAVQIEYDGAAYDHKGGNRKGVASFTLGSAE